MASSLRRCVLLLLLVGIAGLTGCTVSSVDISVATPAGVTVDSGQTATFSITSSSDELRYQWQHSTNAGSSYNNITDATSFSYTTTALSSANNGELYRVFVSQASDVGKSGKSAAATLTVNPALLTSTPSSANGTPGTTATFSTTASQGTAPYSYQWQLSTNSGTSYSNIAGATSSSYTTPTLSMPDNGGLYRVVVTDSAAVPTSVTSNAGTLTVGIALSTSSPSNTTVDAGQTASFSTTASNGTSPYTYQWQVSTGGAYSNVSTGTGGTTASYTTAVLTTGSNGNTYRVVVTDSASTSVNSGAATLTVNAALSTSAPSNTTVDAGQTASFSTTASNGTTPYSYQWQVSTGGAYSNVSTGSGGTTASYTTAVLTTGSSGNTYRVVVTDSAAVPTSVTSGAATLTVNAALSTSTPSNQTISLGITNTATFSTTASNGTSPYAYQWQVNSQGISSFVNVSTGTGGTTASYTTGVLTIVGNDGDLYRVVVTDSAAVPTSVTSGNASLTVTAKLLQPEKLVSLACPKASFCLGIDDQGKPWKYEKAQWKDFEGDLVGHPLSAVSCASDQFCMAISARGQAFLYNGAWSAGTPFGIREGRHAFVSCPAESFCMVVNQNADSFVFDGKAWTYVKGLYSNLAAFSCAGAKNCVATDKNGNVSHYDGNQWQAYAENPITKFALRSVSCVGKEDLFCMGVDKRGSAFNYKGGAWTYPKPATRALLNSVSCVDEKFCMAVSNQQRLWYYEDSAWNSTPIPKLKNSISYFSCPTRSDCFGIDAEGKLWKQHFDLLKEETPAVRTASRGDN